MKRISKEPSSDFEGSHPAVTATVNGGSRSSVSLLQHDADLAHLRWRAAAGTDADAAAASQELQVAERERTSIDGRVRTAVGTVLLQHMPGTQQQLKALAGTRGTSSMPPSMCHAGLLGGAC